MNVVVSVFGLSDTLFIIMPANQPSNTHTHTKTCAQVPLQHGEEACEQAGLNVDVACVLCVCALVCKW